MKLIPVVEFAPTLFQIGEYDIPDGEAEEWDLWWRNSLADSNIIGLDPYLIGSWLVEVNKLTPLIVEILLSKQYDSSVKSVEFSAFEGGYILEDGARLLVLPHCCGSLQDTRDWEDASDWMGTDETPLWIGHPGFMVSSKDSLYL